MSTKPSAELESDEKVQKRAQWEQFSFRVEAPGQVEVTNESHDNSEEHQYVVTLDDVTGDAMACTCPHHVHRSAFCKHMTGVEDATTDGSLDAFPLADTDEDDESDDAEAPSDDESEPPEDCDCDGLDGFPCWECVRTGRKELPA